MITCRFCGDQLIGGVVIICKETLCGGEMNAFGDVVYSNQEERDAEHLPPAGLHSEFRREKTFYLGFLP